MNNYDEYMHQTDIDELEELLSKLSWSVNALDRDGVPFWKTWDGYKYLNSKNVSQRIPN